MLRTLVREEWRSHARLFGGPRFAAFPILITGLAAGAIWGLVWAGTPSTDIISGTVALAVVLGLYTGSVGLTGRDALRGVLGEPTLLMATIGTLPVALRRALAVFLVAEVAYYTALFLGPLTIAFGLAGAVPVVALPRLLLAVIVAFVLGIGTTLMLLGVAHRRRLARALVVIGVVTVVGLWITIPTVRAVSPVAVYTAPLSAGALATVTVTIALAAVGVAVVDPTREPPPRRATDRFRSLRGRLGDADGLLTKSLLDVHRSDGGLVKVAFSGAILFGVAALLVGGVDTITGVQPSVGVAVGALLGLSAFTTYNWLTQFDSIETYAALPVSTPAVFAAKRHGAVILGVPTILAFVALGGLLFGPRPLALVVGAVLAVGIGAYLVGLTALLTGLRPGSFLFDPLRYAAFTVGVAVVLVPVLIVGFVLVPIQPIVLFGLAVLGLVAGLAGYVLYRLAVPRWTRRYRTAEF